MNTDVVRDDYQISIAYSSLNHNPFPTKESLVVLAGERGGCSD